MAIEDEANAPSHELISYERRRFLGVNIHALGRFMLPDRAEYPCQVTEMSPGGAVIITPVPATVGQHVVAYIDHIGRIEGDVVRTINGGFAMTVNATARKREKLAAVLTWLSNRHSLGLADDPNDGRILSREPFSTVVLPGGHETQCKIIDVSLTGASITLDPKPAIGSEITLGRMRARVVHHSDDGIGVEFAAAPADGTVCNTI